jgi:hypothetical protein
MSAAYCLVSASYTGTVQADFSADVGHEQARFWDFSYSGTASFVSPAVTAYNSSNSTSPSGVALTLSGATAYLTIQAIGNSITVGAANSITAVSSPYNTNFSAPTPESGVWSVAYSYILNSSATAAPTWTQSNTTSDVLGITFGVN